MLLRTTLQFVCSSVPVVVTFLRQTSPSYFFKVKLRIHVDPMQQTVTCPGVEIKSVCSTIVPRKTGFSGNRGFDKYAFCPYVEDSSNLRLEASLLWELMDLVVENSSKKRLSVVNIFAKRTNSAAQLFTDFIKVQLRHEVRGNYLSCNTSAVIKAVS